MLLTKTQKEFLESLSSEKAQRVVDITSHDPKTKAAARSVTRKIKRLLPEAVVRFMGSSALGIAGENDVDLYVFCRPDEKIFTRNTLKPLFGSKMLNEHHWDIEEDGMKVSVVLADKGDKKRKEQIQMFRMFKADKNLLLNYERMKKRMNRSQNKEYISAKMDFLMRMVTVGSAENKKNLAFLTKVGAVVTQSHVVTPSGRHATMSFTRYKLYPDTEATFKVARTIAQAFRTDDIEAVVGPAHGGDVLAEIVAHFLQDISGKKVFGFGLEKMGTGGFILKDESNRVLIKGKKTLIVDDTLNEGEALKTLLVYLESLEAKVGGFGVICSRNATDAENLSVPKFYSFITQDDHIYSFPPDDCPLCQKGLPFNKNFGKDS